MAGSPITFCGNIGRDQGKDVMKKIDLGQTVQVLANIGVVAGIVILAIEIQQNTRSLEVGAYQELIGQIGDFIEMQSREPEVALMARAATSAPDLTSEEGVKLAAYFYTVVRLGDLAYYQYERGLLSTERLESVVGPLNDRVCLPFFRQLWARNNSNFVEGYRNYVDAKIESC